MNNTTTPPKSPDSVSAAGLRAVEERYANPANSLEAFILYGARAALRKRDQEHAVIRGVDEASEDVETIYHDSMEETVAEFEDLVD